LHLKRKIPRIKENIKASKKREQKMNKKYLEEAERCSPILPVQETSNCIIETREEFFMRYQQHLNTEYNKKLYRLMKDIHTHCFCGILND